MIKPWYICLWVIALVWWWYVWLQKYNAHYEIEDAFDIAVLDLVEDMKSQTPDIEGSWDFSQTELDTLEHETKKDPQAFLDMLKKSYTQSIQKHNAQSSDPDDIYMRKLDIPAHIAWMTVEQKIAQLFMFWLDGIDMSAEEELFWTTYKPWWAIMMWGNISSDLVTLTEILQQTTGDDIPLWISIDQEWGTVKRVAEDLPAQSEVTLENVCDVYKQRDGMLSRLGINMNFGLVADVTQDKSSFIYPRVFQWEVQEKIAQAVICAPNTLSTVKHFPWHGATRADTHKWWSTMTRDEEQRKTIDLPPFQSAIDAGVEVLMMWHLINPWYDIRPATLSAAWHDYVRQDLAYTWLIVTDDMAMISSNIDLYTGMQQALAAGNDILLYVSLPITQRVELLRQAVIYAQKNPKILDSLDARLERIYTYKERIRCRGGCVGREFWGGIKKDPYKKDL